MCLPTATISESRSQRSSQSSTPTNAHSSVFSTRERSTYPSISAPSKPAPFGDACPSTRAERHWRRPRRDRPISPSENLLSRYESLCFRFEDVKFLQDAVWIFEANYCAGGGLDDWFGIDLLHGSLTNGLGFQDMVYHGK